MNPTLSFSLMLCTAISKSPKICVGQECLSLAVMCVSTTTNPNSRALNGQYAGSFGEIEITGWLARPARSQFCTRAACQRCEKVVRSTLQLHKRRGLHLGFVIFLEAISHLAIQPRT